MKTFYSVVRLITVCALAIAACACSSGGGGGGGTPLASPQVVQLTGKDASLVINWTRLVKTETEDATYEIYGGPSNNFNNASLWKDLDNSTNCTYNNPGDNEILGNPERLCTYTRKGLVNGTEYYVWVKAKWGALGNASPSGPVVGMPVPRPLAPTNLQATARDGWIELTWSSGSPNPKYDFYYDVHVSTSSTGNATPPGNAVAQSVTVPKKAVLISNPNPDVALVNGTAYMIWVRAANTDNYSADYAKLASTVTPASATTAPASAAVLQSPLKAGKKKFSALWNTLLDASHYYIYYGPSTTFGSNTKSAKIPPDIDTISAIVVNLTANTLYYVCVQACNSYNTETCETTCSNQLTVTPTAANPPINFNDLLFALGSATAEFVFSSQNVNMTSLTPSVPNFQYSNSRRDRSTRFQETALGNLFTEAMLWYAKDQYENVDFALLNGGFIDNNIRAGVVTVGSIYTMTYSESRKSKLALVTLTGAEVKQLINYLAKNTPRRGRGNINTGGWPIGSKNISWTLEYPHAPDGTASITNDQAETFYYGRLKPNTLKVNGVPIVDSQSYRVVTTDYLLGGGDGWFLNPRGSNQLQKSEEVWKAVAEYVSEQGVITPQTTNHILVEGGVGTDTGWSQGGWECAITITPAACLALAP